MVERCCDYFHLIPLLLPFVAAASSAACAVADAPPQIMTMLTAAVSSCSFHYRNLLISVVKDSVTGAFEAQKTGVAVATGLTNPPNTLWGRARMAARRILVGHDNRPVGRAGGDTVLFGLSLGTKLAEVLFSVFFMEILEVLLRDLTSKFKLAGIAVSPTFSLLDFWRLDRVTIRHCCEMYYVCVCVSRVRTDLCDLP